MNRINKPNRSSSGIARQLLRVFLLQMLFISAITVAGVYAAAKIVEGVMMRAALEGEANHFWSLLDQNPAQPLPNTDNLMGYLSAGGKLDNVPAELRGMQQGYGRTALNGSEPLVYVEQRNDNILYLVFDEESVSSLSFYFGVVPLSLGLIILYISAWFAYQQSRKAVSPLVQLARTMREFDIETQSLEDLNLGEIGSRPGNYEVEVLIDALNGFTDEIRQLIARERRFTRDASHELRTPLTVIQGSAEWLAENSEMDERQQSTLARILRTVGDMSQLVNALLLLARGVKQRVRTAKINLADTVREITDELELTHNKDGRVKMTLELNEPSTLECSPEGVYMVMSNLLRNAYNYTDKGEVRVNISGGTVEVSNQSAKMEGIELTSLFEPFVRGRGADSKTGSGVGLDIVRRLCDHYNWTVDASYNEDKGLVFKVMFA